MPWTLYRYILKDLLKLLALSTAALVLVISLAGAAQPLSEGLLRPAALLRFVLYSVPAVLQFAVPYAAAFAATALFCRMKNDNEVLACSAAGLSYRALLWPVLLVGLGLTITLFYMNNWWTPRFYRDRQQLILTEDPQVVIDMIRRGQVFQLDDLVIYADSADLAPIPPDALASDNPPIRRMVLGGVAAARYEGRHLRGEVTAEWADVYIYRDMGETWATMRMRNVMAYNPAQGVLAASQDFEVGRRRLAAMNKDDALFLSWPELRQLADAPERFDRVNRARLDLVDVLRAEAIVQAMQQRLAAAEGSLHLQVHDARRYRLTAPEGERIADVLFLRGRDDAPVRLHDEVGGVVQRVVEAAEARLWVQQVDDTETGPRVCLRLGQARVIDARTGQSTGHHELALPRARWPGPVFEELTHAGTRQVLAEARHPAMAAAEPVQRQVARVNNLVGRVLHRAIGQLHNRAATAVSAALVLVLATVLAMRQRGGMLLAVFFWSFLSATAVVIIIQGGVQIATRPDASVLPGLIVLWSGNVALGGVLGWHYWKLSRN
jgi:lipopolysaccharide export system permease protein